MKCWICGAEMKNTIGGCYHCENCGMGAVNDLVMRYPKDFKRVDNNGEKIDIENAQSIGVASGNSSSYIANIVNENNCNNGATLNIKEDNNEKEN